MFEGFRYRVAKNMALGVLRQDPAYSREQLKLMSQIASNWINQEFGTEALRNGSVANKFVAAAAVFARLATVAKVTPTGSIRHQNWIDACDAALLLGKCPRDALPAVRAELMRSTAWD